MPPLERRERAEVGLLGRRMQLVRRPQLLLPAVVGPDQLRERPVRERLRRRRVTPRPALPFDDILDRGHLLRPLFPPAWRYVAHPDLSGLRRGFGRPAPVPR